LYTEHFTHYIEELRFPGSKGMSLYCYMQATSTATNT